MRLLLLTTLAVALPALAYKHGEIPGNVAVRSNGDGEIHHFYEKDRVEHERQKREAEPSPQKQINPNSGADIQLDYYPVKTDEKGNVVPFSGAGSKK